MEYKIWRRLIQILTFREDLIDTIKPFMDNLNNSNNNQIFRINEENHIPFLKSLLNYQIDLLYKYKIINEERFSTLEQKAMKNPQSI